MLWTSSCLSGPISSLVTILQFPLIGTLLNVFILRPPATFYCNFCQRPTIANLYFKAESNTGNFNSFEKWMANPGISFYCFMSGFISLLILSFFTVSNKSSFKFCTKKNKTGNFNTTHKMDGDSWYSFLLFYGLLNSRLNI